MESVFIIVINRAVALFLVSLMMSNENKLANQTNCEPKQAGEKARSASWLHAVVSPPLEAKIECVVCFLNSTI
jgi:hypothetical protein